VRGYGHSARVWLLSAIPLSSPLTGYWAPPSCSPSLCRRRDFLSVTSGVLALAGGVGNRWGGAEVSPA
jgi:hypothetical protein